MSQANIEVLTPEAFEAEWQERQSARGSLLLRPREDGKYIWARPIAEPAQPPAAPGIQIVGSMLRGLFEAALDTGGIDNGVEEIVIRRRRTRRCVRR